jgi:hypothetical protein
LERKFALKGKGANPNDLTLYFTGANTLKRLLEESACNGARDVDPACRCFVNIRLDDAHRAAPSIWEGIRVFS